VAHAVTTWLPLVVIVSIQERHYTYDVTLRRFRVAIGAVEERWVFRILSVFVALIIQHAKRMRRIELSFVACPTVPYFFNTFSQTARYSAKHYW